VQVGNKEGEGGKGATTITIAAGTDTNQLKAAAENKSDYIRCDPT
jgi:hypothetical protein